MHIEKMCLFQMQMRFDGVLGFPGGLIEKGEDPVVGLNREMEEEIGLVTCCF
jgi:U8 snoRNA-decapping enzyme